MKAEILSILQFREGKLLNKYLGAPNLKQVVSKGLSTFIGKEYQQDKVLECEIHILCWEATIDQNYSIKYPKSIGMAFSFFLKSFNAYLCNGSYDRVATAKLALHDLTKRKKTFI